jgi:hypothetical protein
MGVRFTLAARQCSTFNDQKADVDHLGFSGAQEALRFYQVDFVLVFATVVPIACGGQLRASTLNIPAMS